MAIVLVIDDDKDFCETMQSLIERMDHTAISAPSLKEGLSILQRQAVDLLLLDVFLPDGNGIESLPVIKETSLGNPDIFIITGMGDPDGAEIAIKEGVWDYIVKPTKIKEIRLSLNRALKYREEKSRKQKAVNLNLERVIGQSAAIKQSFELITQAATSNAPVLITGETGTGKELFAKTIHDNSLRRQGEFVVVDCASLTENLLESTLFGHKKGSFTGADEQKSGLISLANGGTLFLDEVAEMPLTTQKSFLRVLQEKRYRPLGENRELTSDFRLIAATNRNLHDMVDKKEFRKDLLFRLCAIQIKIPPLRERQDDIKLLSLFHTNRLCEEYKIPNKGFEQGFFETLNAYNWPGNVRELFHTLETALIASGSEKTLFAMHLPKEIRIKVTKSLISKGIGENSVVMRKEDFENDRLPDLKVVGQDDSRYPSLKEFKVRMEKHYLKALIADAKGDLTEILNRSGLSKSHYYGLLKKHGIR